MDHSLGPFSLVVCLSEFCRLRVSHWPLTMLGDEVIERPWTSPPECLRARGHRLWVSHRLLAVQGDEVIERPWIPPLECL
jgi:hypothetical protein